MARSSEDCATRTDSAAPTCKSCVTHLLVKGHNMQVPLDITFRNSETSEAIRSEVEKQAKRLEKFHERITSCHVTVIAPTMKRRHGDLFKIDICVAMPQHKDILVSKAHARTRARHGRDQGCIRGGTAPDRGCRARNARLGQAGRRFWLEISRKLRERGACRRE